MNDEIELQNLETDNFKETDSEVYHEISQEVIEEKTYPNKTLAPVTEHDFFTQYDTKKVQKTAKKKKGKKKGKSKDLMDVINSEIATKPLLIENNITTLDYNSKVDKYLKKVPSTQRILHRRSTNIDAEHGFHIKCTANISPIFPRVLENSDTKETNIHVQYMKPSLFNEIVSEYLENDGNKTPRFFDVILRNIQFKHHHEFSLEELLSVKLIEVYEEYQFVKKTLIDLSKNVEINRRTRNNLKEQLFKISPNRKDDIRFDSSILKYTNLMFNFKEKYFKMLKIEKELANKLISLWSDIEMVREKSGYYFTNYVLEVTHIDSNNEEFRKQWSQIFETEYSDLILKIEHEFIIKYLEYKQTKYNDGHNEKIKIVKPKLKIDYDELKTEVEDIVSEILPKNKIGINLKQDKVILFSQDHRKASIAKNIFFKVYVDDVFVCESEVYESKSGQWDVNFEECLSIEILPQNNNLRIVLFENDEDVSSLIINLSDIKKNTNESNFVSKEFYYNKVVEPTSKKIGCGYNIKDICLKNKARLKSSNLFVGKLVTRCEVNIKLGWNEKLNNNEFESVKSCMKTGRQLQRLKSSKDQPNIDVITEIINDLYENKVEDNENVMNTLKNICKGTVKKNETFKFNEDDMDMARYKLLHLRNSGGFADIQNKTIPLLPSQISTEQLDCLQKSNQKDVENLNLKNNLEMESIDLQRFIGVKYVENLNRNLMKNINECLLKKTYKDVVRDFADVSFGVCLNRAEETLNTSSHKQQNLLKQQLSKEHEIHITVLRAFNLSDRNTQAFLMEQNSEDENIAGFKVHPLRPFVRMSYHGVSTQTATAIGCHPTWNHTVKIKTKFEPLSSIQINIYDECKDNTNESYSDDPSTQSTVYYRKCNKWLGTLKVPLHTVLTLGSIRGTFKIATPPLIFGYENIAPKEPQSFIPEVSQLFKKDTPLIVLQITTSISHFGGFRNYYQPISNDPKDNLIRHLNELVSGYVNEFPTRNISLTFIDSSGKNKCVSEFLQPIPLPDYEYFPINPRKAESAVSKSSGHSKSSSSRSSRKKSSITEESLSGFEVYKNEGNQFVKNMEAAIRYVSLIPTYEVSENHIVTLMGVELLKVLYGSPLDHTILLASYFLNLGIRCWIIIGFGLPRGFSSYVLVKYQNNKIVMCHNEVKSRGFLNKSEDSSWYIYDAVAGERFELRDVGCPLKTVSYVFDCENIWVNGQTSEDCESVAFDFSKSSDWQTVFDKPLLASKPTLIESLYSKPEEMEKLRLNLETKVKNKVQKWRSHVKTIWNRYCSSLLREMLPHYEYWAFNPTEPRPNLGHRLKQLMATYKIFGFPLNMTYLNTKLILSGIKSTAIHVNDDPNVEFGLGVEVYAYPNNVLSVWVFLASVTRI
ncbi:unnamed protein product, partial [Brenthis ino]